MELFSIKLSYTMPPSATRDAEHHEASTAVAVYGSFGPGLIQMACAVAVQGVVGVVEEADLARWQVMISAVNYLGTVHVEQVAPLTPEKGGE